MELCTRKWHRGAKTRVPCCAGTGGQELQGVEQRISQLPEVTRLEWKDERLGEVDFPSRILEIKSGFGSGLTRHPAGPPDIVWAVCDRGPNLKIREATEAYGWSSPTGKEAAKDAKLMPRTDIGPSIAKLRLVGDAVELVEILKIRDGAGSPVSGCPIPMAALSGEQALDLQGRELPPDSNGMDTEGIALLGDGTFWLTEEYGPSLIKLDASGKMLRRLVPDDLHLSGANPPAEAILPALARRRKLNRGFEAIAVTPSGESIFVAFQSPLAHPDRQVQASARHVRIWQLDASGAVQQQYLYPLDPPESFLRDNDKGKVRRSDLKLCEMVAVGEDALIVLERASETSKIYHVRLGEALRLPQEHFDVETRSTVEELSGTGDDMALPVLEKTVLLSSDDHPEIEADIEGMALLSDTTLLIVSDNDFGVGEKSTGFFRIDFDRNVCAD